jgi:hypothetical protein
VRFPSIWNWKSLAEVSDVETSRRWNMTIESVYKNVRIGSQQTGTRRWKRHRVDVPVRVIVHRCDRTSLFDGRGTELSEGGMAVTAGVELRLGDDVDIEFTPPYSGIPIRTTGTIRNRTGYRYGVEFVSDSRDQREQICRLLAGLANA